MVIILECDTWHKEDIKIIIMARHIDMNRKFITKFQKLQ